MLFDILFFIAGVAAGGAITVLYPVFTAKTEAAVTAGINKVIPPKP